MGNIWENMVNYGGTHGEIWGKIYEKRILNHQFDRKHVGERMGNIGETMGKYWENRGTYLNGNSRNLNWRHLPYIRPIFQGYVREYPHNM